MSTTPGQVLGGRYQLRSVIGRGGMATVWAGLDTRLDRPVAVKVLDGGSHPDTTAPVDPEAVDREARALARLAHPTIVAVHDVGTDGGVAFVVMELVDGDDLRHRLARGPVPVPEAVAIAAQVCHALEAAHEAGVVHLDIKPENILLTGAGSVKVCDLGIARLHEASRAERGTVVGTAEYMAPEQGTGAEVGPQADLYALGCVLYRMLADRPVFTSDDPARLLWLHAHQAPTPLAQIRPDLPAELAELVDHLLAKDPAQRPASAGEVRARLSRLSDGAPAVVGTAATRPRAWSGTAPVVARTRTLPALPDVEEEPRPTFHLGPAGIGIVAVGAAVVTALAVALAMAPQRPPATAAPGATSPTVASSASAEPSATVTMDPDQALDAVRAVISAQVATGQLESRRADDLGRDLAAIERHLDRGDYDRAANRIRDLRRRLDELRREDRLSNAGHAAIWASLDQLEASLPADEDDDDD